jgi:hypothetical protein
MKKDEQTYYEIINAREDADAFELRDCAQAVANRVSEAYRILQDPEQRTQYDDLLRQQRQQHKNSLKRRHQLKIIALAAFFPLLIAIILALVYRLSAWGFMEYEIPIRLPPWFFLQQTMITISIIGLGLLWSLISALFALKRILR